MRGASATAHCEFDDWEFTPRYTDGACPLCGWHPSDITSEVPLTQRVDWFFVMLAAVVVVSIVMGILVVHAYNRA